MSIDPPTEIESPTEEIDPDEDPSCRDDIDADDERSDDDTSEEWEALEERLEELGLIDRSSQNNTAIVQTRNSILEIEQANRAQTLLDMAEGFEMRRMRAARIEASRTEPLEPSNPDASQNEWLDVMMERYPAIKIPVRIALSLLILAIPSSIAYLIYLALTRGKFKPDSEFSPLIIPALKADADWRKVSDRQFFGHVADHIRRVGLHQPMQFYLADGLAEAFPEHEPPLFRDGEIRRLVTQLSQDLDRVKAGDPLASVFDVLAANGLRGTSISGEIVPLRRNQACVIAQVALLSRIDPKAVS